MTNIGIFNNNYKGGKRFDEPKAEPLTPKQILEVRAETLRDLLRPGVIPEGSSLRETVTKRLQEVEGQLNKHPDPLVDPDLVNRFSEPTTAGEMVDAAYGQADLCDPRIARRENIHAAFKEEPLTKEEADELFVELAEIDQSLGINPSDTLQARISASWDLMDEIIF